MCGYSVAKKHIGRGEREISLLVYGYFDFQKPSIQGVSTVADPADRTCKYLA
jgi:hypothetical protein